MAEIKKFTNPVECFNSGWIKENTYEKQAIRQENGGKLEYFSLDEWDVVVTLSRKPRFFKKNDYVESTVSADVSYYTRNGWTEVTIKSKES